MTVYVSTTKGKNARKVISKLLAAGFTVAVRRVQ
jgi:hypothetical protein